MNMLGMTLHELLGGRLDDGKNNILKSPQVVRVDDDSVTFATEPYDDSFDLNHPDETFDKIERVLNRRKKAILKAIDKPTAFFEVYDDMEMIGSVTLLERVEELEE